MPQIIKGKSKWTPKLGRKHATNQNNVEEYTPPAEEHIPISNLQNAQEHNSGGSAQHEYSNNSYYSQPQHLIDTTNNDDSCHQNQSSIVVDDDIDIKQSTSSNCAVLMASPSPSTSSMESSSQLNPIPYAQEAPNKQSGIALETPQDKVDDEAYSQWWFLTSISESFDTNANQSTQPPNNSNNNTPATSKEDKVKNESPISTSSGVAAQLQKYGIEMKPCESPMKKERPSKTYELPPWNKSHIRQQQQQHQPPNMKKSKKITERDYIAKEQQMRNEWIAKNRDAFGGAIKYDKQGTIDEEDSESSTPYHYVPPKQPSIPPTTTRSTASWRSATSWDVISIISNRGRSRSRTQSTSESQIDWTPQDSSYGAAVPAFGWIPKRIRKLLEGIILFIIVCLLLYVVVRIGIMLNTNSSSNGQDITFDDDDHYEAYENDGRDNNDGSESNDNDGSNDNDQDRMI